MDWNIEPAIDHPMFFGAMEESELEDRVYECLREFAEVYGSEPTISEFERVLNKHSVVFVDLPKYLQAELDKVDIVTY